MKKKKNLKIILGITLIILVSMGIVLLVKISNKNVDKPKTDDNKNTTKIVDDYYKKMHKKMYDYYMVMYKTITVPEKNKEMPIIITLGDLKRKGFPMDEFVNKDTKDECDPALSYAIRSVVDSKYRIQVYYKCGTTANYDFTKREDTLKKNESD